MIENYYYLLIGITLFLFILWFINKRFNDIKEFNKIDGPLLEWLKSSQSSWQQTSRDLNDRLDNAAKIISSVQRGIGEMSEIGRSMKQLQQFLNSPKLRGNISEQVLEQILSQLLPRDLYRLQYTFRSGVKVDAIIKTSGGIIPIDAKFPLENFRKMAQAGDQKESQAAQKLFFADLKKHIDSIAGKYILSDEGTIDYAIMYLPSEAVYYEVVNNPEIYDYAGRQRVLPVSSMTLYAFLRAILMSFEGQKIEQEAKKIIDILRSIKTDYRKVEGNISVLGRHLQNAYNQMANVSSSINQLGQKLSSTDSLPSKVGPIK